MNAGCYIELTKGRWSRVSSQHYDELAKLTWATLYSRGMYYAVRSDGQGGLELMHRRICGAEPGDRVVHLDGNGLNNQRDNLRLVKAARFRRGPVWSAGPEVPDP